MTQRALIWIAVSSAHQADDDRASLPAQEADALAYAQSQNWRVVDILRVPGHSRAYIDIHEAAADMRNVGIDAFDKLMQHWKARDFDVLICRDGTRFARTQALHAYVVEKTISIGARIYSLSERLTVDDSNARMWTSMGGFAAAGEVDNLKRRIKIGKDNRALSRGLSSNGYVPRSHRLIRDPGNGKIIGAELNPDTAQEWQDLAALLLEGVAYATLSDEMFRRFGYATDNRAHSKNYYTVLLHTPAFWGHTARNYDRYKMPVWTYQDDEPVPAPALINRYTHAPVYIGEQADRIRAELSRRLDMRGRSYAADTSRLSGMVNCAGCGYRMTYQSQRHNSRINRYLVCMSKYSPAFDKCCIPQERIPETVAVEQINLFLARLQQFGALALSASLDVDLDGLTSELTRLTSDIERVENQIRTLIDKQATAPVTVSALYDERITAAAGYLDTLQTRRHELEATIQSVNTEGQRDAVEHLQTMTLDDFWQQDERVVNQQLHRLFGKHRFFVQDKKIVGLAIPARGRGKHLHKRAK